MNATRAPNPRDAPHTNARPLSESKLLSLFTASELSDAGTLKVSKKSPSLINVLG